MKQSFTCFLLCVFLFSLIDTTPINGSVVFEELIKSIDKMNEMIKVGVQSLHSPINIPDHCVLSAFKCFVNESLLLKPAHGKNEKLFSTTLSRIHSSQRNVERILEPSVQNCYSCVDYPKQSEKVFCVTLNHCYKGSIKLLMKHEGKRTSIT